MDVFAEKLNTFVTDAKPIVIAAVAVALLINGVCMIWPNERAKEKAKDAIPWVAIGSAIALGAVQLAQSLTSGF